MAYGNWGAFVYRNGERMTQWEDNTPYRETELQAGYWQAFAGTGAHHAVLGEKRVRLCGYKCYPSLMVDGVKADIDSYGQADPSVDDSFTGSNGVYYPDFHHFSGDINLDGDTYHLSADRDGNMLDLELIEPDGTKWTARCGFEYGAGHMD